MNTYNVCFYGEIRKIIPELSPDTFLTIPLIYGIKIWQFDMKGLYENFNFGAFIFLDVCHTTCIYTCHSSK